MHPKVKPPWEGRPSLVRAKVTGRGSAAGAGYAGSAMHVMVGYTDRMAEALSACGVAFPQYVLRPIGRMTDRAERGIPMCQRAECAEALRAAATKAAAEVATR